MQNTRIYQSLKQINIITFWEMAESEDFRLMDMDYEEDKEYSDEEVLVLKSAFLKLYDDYFQAKDSSVQRNSLQSNDKLNREAFKIYLLEELFKSLQIMEINKFNLKADDYADILQQTYTHILDLEKHVRIDRMGTIKANAEKLRRVIDSLTNKLTLSDTRSRQEVKKEAKKFRNHYENIAGIEQVLERSIGDVSKINCLQWLAYEKEAEKLIKMKQQHGNRSTK